MSRKGLLNWGLALVVAVGGLGASWALLVGKPKPAPGEMPEASPPLVQYIPVVPELRSLPVATQGTVRAEREITLTAQVAGRVVSVRDNFAAGGFFAAGEPLLQIEQADYELAIARAESQVASAQQVLAEEEGRALQSRREWRDLGTVKANSLFLREPQLAAAKAALAAAEADLGGARRNLERTTLSLPFNGRLVSKAVDVGQYVAAGAAVAVAYGTDRVQVRLPITDRQMARLDLPLGMNPGTTDAVEGPAVELAAVFAGRRWEWSGRIARTEARIDEDSRVLYAIALVDNPFPGADDANRPPLTPGLFVDAAIAGRPLPELAELPRNALRSDGSVLLVDGESRLRTQSVRMLHSDGRRVWLSGLEAGDRVVVSDDGLLVSGMSVTATPAEQFADGGLR